MQGIQGKDETMENSMRDSVEPGKQANPLHIAAISSGLGFFWCCLFSELTGFSAKGEDALVWWNPIACRIAFFACFALFACFIAHLPFGVMGKLLAPQKSYVLIPYLLNLIMVSIDIALYARNKKLEDREASHCWIADAEKGMKS